MSNIDMDDLIIKQAAIQHCHSNWYWDSRVTWSGQAEYVIWVVDSGSGKLNCPDREYKLSRGDVFVMPVTAERHYTASHNPDDPISLSWVDFRLADQPELAPFHLRSVNLNMLQTIIMRITKVATAEKNIWVRALISEINFQNGYEQDNRAMQQIMDICDQIKANPGKYRTIDDLQLNYSKEHLIRLFKIHKGITPRKYMIRCRINAAMRLLKTTDLSIQDISEELDYRDMFAFSKQFKSVTGLTPSAYRKS